MRRHFLGWNRPLLELAAGFLERDNRKETLDLSNCLVVTPTRHSGRRLRETLAARASARGGGVLPPLVVTPEYLLTHSLDPARCGTVADSILAWTEVLLHIDLEAHRPLFPVDPPIRGFRWSLQSATEMHRLRAVLAESGFTFAQVMEVMGSDWVENERWRSLARLESDWRDCLFRRGVEDREDLKLEHAQHPSLPPGIRSVVLLGVPDPVPLAVSVLERLAEEVTVDVAVFAPESEAGAFDPWGRPTAEVWEQRSVTIPQWETVTRVMPTPSSQAGRAAETLSQYRNPAGFAAVGVCDAAALPFLENAFAEAGMETFDPGGKAFKDHELAALFRTLNELLRTGSMAACGDLVRSPYFHRSLEMRAGRFKVSEFLTEWDRFREERLPDSLDDIIEYFRDQGSSRTVFAVAVTFLTELREDLARGPFPECLLRVCRVLFHDVEFPPAGPGKEFAEAIRLAVDVAGELADCAARFSLEHVEDGMELFLALMEEQVLAGDREECSVDLQGWLELQWEDAPHLLLTGFNEGCVPQAVKGDPFLPEGLRTALGMPGNRFRFARDVYVFESLFASRSSGRVEILLGKESRSGDPMRPSRLLFRCAPEELSERVRFLFGDLPSTQASPPWQAAWKLRPRALPPDVETVAVTGFARYLRCPFRYYLNDRLRMEPVDPRKAEMDALDFGNLCHAVLQKFGEDELMRQCTDEEALSRFLQDELQVALQRRYGRALPTPIQLQADTAAHRLREFARIQVQEREKGWEIVDVEWSFINRQDLKIDGLRIGGKIDRIERNTLTGEFRVLDYKTSDKANPPETDHWKLLRKGEDPTQVRDYALFDWKGKSYRWTGLQLPLYRWALEGEYGAGVNCGYFNLPKALGETGIVLWNDGIGDWVPAALECAVGVVRDIRAGRFWPPAERVKHDDFDRIFFQGAVASVEPLLVPVGKEVT